MTISVIIPVYNVAPYIERCIQSIIDQTYQHLEVIIVDDCGTDNSMEILERVLKENGFCLNSVGIWKSTLLSLSFRLIHHESNRGLSAARNTGIKNATGEYIYFLDSDDSIVPECIGMLVNCLKKHIDSQVVFAGAEVAVDYFPWLDYTKKHLPDYTNDHNWLQISLLRRFDFGMTAWNKLISRDFILKNNLFFVEGVVHEDEVWNFEMSKAIQSASFIRSNTYLYNTHSKGIVSNVSADQRWKRRFILWDILISKLGDDSEQIQIRAISNFIFHEVTWNSPENQRIKLCLLFWKLSIKSASILSVLLFLQGLLSLCYPYGFFNPVTSSRLRL